MANLIEITVTKENGTEVNPGGTLAIQINVEKILSVKPDASTGSIVDYEHFGGKVASRTQYEATDTPASITTAANAALA